MKSSNPLRQLRLLCAKNWFLTKRSIKGTIVEVLAPLFFLSILLAIRSMVDIQYISETTEFKQYDIIQQIKILSALGIKKEILFTPNTNLTTRIMDKAAIYLSLPKPPTGYKNEKDLLDAYSIVSEPTYVLGGVVFQNLDVATTIPKSVKYKIRPPTYHADWRTNVKFPFKRDLKPLSFSRPDYYKSGFIFLQYAIDAAIIELTSNYSVSPSQNKFRIFMQRIPFPPYSNDPFFKIIQYHFPLILMLSYIYISAHITRNIVYEREKRLMEAMKLMGLKPSIYWLSWFIRYIIFFLAIACISTVFLSFTITERALLPNSEASLIFVFLLLYGLTVICFCFMLTVLFNRANSAAYGGGMIFFLTYIPQFYFNALYENMSKSVKLGLSLISNVAMCLGARIISQHEGTGHGARWRNLYEPAVIDDNLSLCDILLMMSLDCIIYMIILWYASNVRPGKFGIPLPWYSPFMKSYWCSTESTKCTVRSVDEGNVVKRVALDTFERDPVGFPKGIVIKNLRKVFGTGESAKTAVVGTTLTLYQNQITSLLGHNGAGKTTTMSMLTGFIPPTSGTAIVNGYDIKTDIASVRRTLGLCPQHDILFDNLTVDEHLWFFSKLKGLNSKDTEEEIDKMVKVLRLEEKRFCKSEILSAGQKRNLSVGIALCADSKIIILDEPSSGLDPSARRQLWDILLAHREGRTILLSTHFMDEADVLSDRIAIMADGVVKCCGSSLYLKKKYGAGYHLRIIKAKTCKEKYVTRFVRSHVRRAKMHSNIAAELSYTLPHEESAKFENLFQDLSDNMSSLCIQNFGLSETTMEDVFLKVEKDTVDNDCSATHTSTIKTLTSSEKLENSHEVNQRLAEASIVMDLNDDIEKNNGYTLICQQFYGMIIKKFIITWRNRLVTIVQIFFPLFFTLLVLGAHRLAQKVSHDKPIYLSLFGYEKNFVPFSAGSNGSQEMKNIRDSYGQMFSGTNVVVVKGVSVNGKPSFSMKYFKERGKNETNVHYITRYLVGLDLSYTDGTTSIVTYYSGEGYHLMPIALSYTMNALISALSGPSFFINVTNDPLPISGRSKGFSNSINFPSFDIAQNVFIGLSFTVSTFLLFLIKEKTVGAKHVQLSSGTSLWVFWGANFIWDMINFIIPCLILLIFFVAFQIKAYTGENRLRILLLSFLLFGWSIIPLIYLLHFPFKRGSTGMAVISILNILFGMATVLSVILLKGVHKYNAADRLVSIFRIISPHFCFLNSIIDIYTNYEVINRCKDYVGLCERRPNPCCKATGKCGPKEKCRNFEENYLAFTSPGIGSFCLAMAIQGAVFMTLTLIIDFDFIRKLGVRMCRRAKRKTNEEASSEHRDADVLEEESRVAKHLTELLKTNVLVVNRMVKKFGDFKPVDSLSFALPAGECFGLLGVNGAGKTATFKMLTGEYDMTSGDAYINGNSVTNKLKKVQGDLGYCPQFDTLLDQMTGRELLFLYARIRGIKARMMSKVVASLLEAFMLSEHADKQTYKYSGGNKRKLSTAISVIGNPKITFMDEPTTGMDPAARRRLGDLILHIRSTGGTIIFTSHSMEECDALCTRVAIMVNGVFRCLGSCQHLKHKYGEGYTLSIRMNPEAYNKYITRLSSHIESSFKDCERLEATQGYINYQLTDPSLSLSHVFSLMEKARVKYEIEDYSVSQTTLDQIFINFARLQIDLRSKSYQKNRCYKCLARF